MAALVDSLMQIGEELTPVAVASTSAQSAAINSGQAFALVRLVSSVRCHVAFGTNPVATTNNAPLPADSVEYFKMNSGDRIAVIRSSSDGTLNISRMV